MRVVLTAVIAAFTFGFTGGALAADLGRMTPGYTYFNRPGADAARHQADLAYCMSQASLTQAGANFGAQGGLLMALIEASATGRGVSVNVENCMVALGWRVVALPEEEGVAMAAMPSAELLARLEPWLGAEEPHGSILRVWSNDADRASTDRFSEWPAPNVRGQLSVRTVSKDTISIRPPAVRRSERLKLEPGWSVTPLKAKALEALPDGAALLVVRLRGQNTKTGMNLVFSRLGPDPEVRPALVDRRPDYVTAAIGLLFTKPEGDFFAFAVPAGRWRIHGMNDGMLSFCLGAPSFEVSAGEVVYAGTFDFKAESFAPDLSLEPAKAYLAGLTLAERVRPAAYVNGSRDQCAGAGLIYSLEIEGAPREPERDATAP